MASFPQPVHPTGDEKTFATLAHALQVIGFWLAPLIILLVKNDSLFVRFHALNALLLQCFKTVLIVLAMALMFTIIFFAAPTAGKGAAGPMPAFIAFLPLIWIVIFIGSFLLELTLAIVFAIKAGRGEWDGYPVIGPLAARLLNIKSSSPYVAGS